MGMGDRETDRRTETDRNLRERKLAGETGRGCSWREDTAQKQTKIQTETEPPRDP